MRFDDTLETVLASDLRTPFGVQSAWRQLTDLVGRRRVVPDTRVLAALRDLRGKVPATVRAASARSLEYANPPAPLVRLFALDDAAVAAPALRSARLAAAEWIQLLPDLTPAGRAILRNRRDLSPAVQRALESFGPVDFVLPDNSPVPVEQEAETAPAAAEPSLAEADAGTFEIAEVVARIDAFWRKRETDPAPMAAMRVVEAFRFETDGKGIIRWVDGVSRGPVIGISLDAGDARVDGTASGALRHRAAFSHARLRIEGESDAAGDWLISGIPAFDPASGRFTGYRGTARRPRPDERAEPPAEGASHAAADSLRQLVHELRTPTNAIAGFAEMIESQMLGPVSAVYRERAHIIRAQARELLGAIDDLDLAARIDSAALALIPGRVALRPLLESIAEDLGPLAELRGAMIALPIDDASVVGDRRAVERLLSRLLATLVSASAPGERIGVYVTHEAVDRVAIAIDRPRALADYPGDSVLGIDDERDDTTLLGTGFALRLARNLARELGGSLAIGSDRLTLRLAASVISQVGQAHLN
ncbi:sensor histidine kinase [Sphingomonas sp. S2-65]|uniref:sensor histidine kinase n=1 Tax=Sphingomonas sp. S2-65 TaxID=2903960 RepID=UPI001F31F908|nr:HAMP domain-containing sensor histidine kinase [Sphingomonas sp. S2-65]UYY59072.1 HAMP domain-containing histidine kinase [Sphingomonas sp. S2-65]